MPRPPTRPPQVTRECNGRNVSCSPKANLPCPAKSGKGRRSLRRAIEREPARSLAAGTMLGCEGEFEAADRLSAAEASLETAGATSRNKLTQTLAAMPQRRDFKTRRRPRDAAEDRQQQAEGGDRFRQPLPGPVRTVIDNCHNGSSN